MSTTAWMDEDLREERQNHTGMEFKQRSTERGPCQYEAELLVFVCQCILVFMRTERRTESACENKRHGLKRRNTVIISGFTGV